MLSTEPTLMRGATDLGFVRSVLLLGLYSLPRVFSDLRE
jgi:hypothetical protein